MVDHDRSEKLLRLVRLCEPWYRYRLKELEPQCEDPAWREDVLSQQAALTTSQRQTVRTRPYTDWDLTLVSIFLLAKCQEIEFKSELRQFREWRNEAAHESVNEERFQQILPQIRASLRKINVPDGDIDYAIQDDRTLVRGSQIELSKMQYLGWNEELKDNLNNIQQDELHNLDELAVAAAAAAALVGVGIGMQVVQRLRSRKGFDDAQDTQVPCCQNGHPLELSTIQRPKSGFFKSKKTVLLRCAICKLDLPTGTSVRSCPRNECKYRKCAAPCDPGESSKNLWIQNRCANDHPLQSGSEPKGFFNLYWRRCKRCSEQIPPETSIKECLMKCGYVVCTKCALENNPHSISRTLFLFAIFCLLVVIAVFWFSF